VEVAVDVEGDIEVEVVVDAGEVEVIDVMEEVVGAGDVDVLVVVEVVVAGVVDFPQETAVKIPAITKITKAAVINIFCILFCIFSSLQALLPPSTINYNERF
jgi:hypothetical protein